MSRTSPSAYVLRLTFVMSAFAAAFAVVAIPLLKAEAPVAPTAPIESSMDKSRPPTLLNAQDEPRFQAALDCLKHERSQTIAQCMHRALK